MKGQLHENQARILTHNNFDMSPSAPLDLTEFNYFIIIITICIYVIKISCNCSVNFVSDVFWLTMIICLVCHLLLFCCCCCIGVCLYVYNIELSCVFSAQKSRPSQREKMAIKSQMQFLGRKISDLNHWLNMAAVWHITCCRRLLPATFLRFSSKISM